MEIVFSKTLIVDDYELPDHVTVVYKILLTYNYCLYMQLPLSPPKHIYLEEASPRTSPSIVKAIDLVRQCSVRKFYQDHS